MCTTSSSSVLAATTGWKRCKASFRATTLACTCQTLNDTPSSQTRGTMHSITKHVACVVLEAVNITTKESCVHDKRCESQCELCEDSSLLNFLSLAKVFFTKPPQQIQTKNSGGVRSASFGSHGRPHTHCQVPLREQHPACVFAKVCLLEKLRSRSMRHVPNLHTYPLY